jgi:hypothetical protein
MAKANSIRFTILFLMLAASSCFAQTCTSQRTFRVNNAWIPGGTIPYGLALELFNPAGSGCDLYIQSITLSAGATSGPAYIEFGAAFTNALMPGCTANLDVTDLASLTSASLPGGISGIGNPCGPYTPISTGADGRWTLANGHPYEEEFEDPHRIPPGLGYSIWTSPAGYPAVRSATGDLTITLTIITVPSGVQLSAAKSKTSR